MQNVIFRIPAKEKFCACQTYTICLLHLNHPCVFLFSHLKEQISCDVICIKCAGMVCQIIMQTDYKLLWQPKPAIKKVILAPYNLQLNIKRGLNKW